DVSGEAEIALERVEDAEPENRPSRPPRSRPRPHIRPMTHSGDMASKVGGFQFPAMIQLSG
ncbi:MAG: hypothetical protein ACTHLR_06910, partial [Rhizomicrobium sp.]